MNQKELITMVAQAEGLKSREYIFARSCNIHSFNPVIGGGENFGRGIDCSHRDDIREIWKLIKRFNYEFEGAVEVILEGERRNKMAKKKTMKKKVTPKKK